MAGALIQVRLGPTAFPGYSHDLYDVDPALTRLIDRPDVLIIEGMGLDGAPPLDRLIFLDADHADQQAWYVARFVEFWEDGRVNDRSFYARFRELDRDAVAGLAAMVWRTVNLPNLETHIEPLRRRADLIVTKGSDHGIRSIAAGDGVWGP